MPKHIRRILIANRGEIALRIIRACKELSIRTIAIYSEADKFSHFVSQADEAYPIGPAPSSESYLRMDKIISVAKSSNCDAIHPGYGFLAENHLFADACKKNKLIFIGPSAHSIKAIGNKINARRLAKENGIQVVPGLTISSIKNISHVKNTLAKSKITYPLLIKAAAGGGGKGMRVVYSEKELIHSLREASNEAMSAFGDPTIFIEKYLRKPRHIEIQVLADNFGNVIHLGERECSIQRRHQKLVEESPSPFVNDALRTQMGETAKKIARLAKYTGAGTVEFLVDDRRNFYFLEVNTRLQVEHPVTEMTTGIDIVKEQIMIASGGKLSIKQEDVKRRGHSIECRVLAEDPFNNFIPSTGEIIAVKLPSGPFTRVDTDVVTGTNVTVYYDSLLAKLIVWGQDRRTAIRRMLRALRESKILGVRTTIPFHVQLLQCREFLSGNISTKFVEESFKLKADAKAHLFEAILITVALENSKEPLVSTSHTTTYRDVSRWKQALVETFIKNSQRTLKV